MAKVWDWISKEWRRILVEGAVVAVLSSAFKWLWKLAEDAGLGWANEKIGRAVGPMIAPVTSFLFQLHPLSTVYAGPMLWSMDKAGDVMRWYRDFLPAAPDEVNGFFAFLTVPGGPPFP